MQLSNKFEKAKWCAGVVKDAAQNFGDAITSGLVVEGYAMAGMRDDVKRTRDAVQSRVDGRNAARRANKPA